MKPVIGITCKKEYIPEIYPITHRGAAGQCSQYVLQDYLDRIAEAGGAALLIPICEDPEVAKELLHRVDGVIFMGGADVSPQYYGERLSAYCGNIYPHQDEQELEMARYLLRETEKPVLGVCRGIQILNVALGGTLYQDLTSQGGYEHHRCLQSPEIYPVHTVNLQPNTTLFSIFGTSTIEVNSYHHQAIKTLAKELVPVGTTPDGLVEAVEYPGKKFAVGVQWHPEMMSTSEDQKKIFRALVAAAAQT